MTRHLLPISALLLGVAFLFVAGGLHGLLLPIRGGLEGFLPTHIGLMGTTWAGGYIAGCLIVPWLVRRVGHVRTFGFVSATAAITVLLTLLLIDPIAWIALRSLTGFCFAGSAMIIESWLNERASNETRGTIFSLYMSINLGASMVGQMLIALGDPAGYVFFVLAAILFCMALVPTALSTAAAPRPLVSSKLRLGLLYRTSPVAMVGSFSVGVANGAFGTLGPVYGQQIGLPVGSIALLMATALLGGALSQVPMGRISDTVDRRYVIIAASLVAAAMGVAFYVVHPVDTALLVGMAIALGASLYPLYSLNVAHANDFAAPEQFVEVSTGLILVYGVGTMVGPTVAAIVMEQISPQSLFGFTAIVHLWVAAHTTYRTTRRRAKPAAERPAYTSMPLPRTTTPETAALAHAGENQNDAAKAPPK